MKEELLKGLSEEQIAKIKACKSQEEILKLAKEEDVELTEEQLAAVNGGCSSTDTRKVCPHCGSKNTELSPNTKGKSVNGMLVTYYKCKDCKKVFYVI
ncbi:MAG: hypothetical protein SPL00_04200 [Bacilli bacterium]|nr:hypothetical protein [Bacilli bacterium]